MLATSPAQKPPNSTPAAPPPNCRQRPWGGEVCYGDSTPIGWHRASDVIASVLIVALVIGAFWFAVGQVILVRSRHRKPHPSKLRIEKLSPVWGIHAGCNDRLPAGGRQRIVGGIRCHSCQVKRFAGQIIRLDRRFAPNVGRQQFSIWTHPEFEQGHDQSSCPY